MTINLALLCLCIGLAPSRSASTGVVREPGVRVQIRDFGVDRPPELAPAFPRIRKLGVIRSDPQRETEAFLWECDRAADLIRSYCALGDPSLPSVYITQGPWAWGDGSADNPFVIDPDPLVGGAQLDDMIDDIQAQYPNGSEIWLDAAIEVRMADHAYFELIAPFTHLRGWDRLGTGARPLLHKWSDFAPVWTPVVEPVSGRTYYTTPWAGAPQIRLAMGDPVEDASARRYREEAFLDCGTTERFEHVIFKGSTNAFQVEGGVIKVYLTDGRDPSGFDLQLCRGAAGFVGIRTDGIVVEGLHLNGGDQVNETYLIRCTVGDAAYVVRDCFLADAFKHIVGTAGAGTDNAVALSEHNVITGGRSDEAGFTHEVNYADQGDCDYLSLHNTFISGAHGPDRTRGQLLFSHSKMAIGSPPMGSVIIGDFDVDTIGFTGIKRYLGVLSKSDREIYAQVGGRVKMDISGWGTLRADGGTTSPGAFDAAFGSSFLAISELSAPIAAVDVDVTYRTYPDINKGAFVFLSGVDADIMNCNVNVELPVPSSDPPGDDRARIARVGEAVDLRFYNTDFRVYYAGGDEQLIFFWDVSGGDSSIDYYGCSWTFEGATSQMSRGL